MEDNKNKRYTYLILESNNPVLLNDISILEHFNEYSRFEINKNNHKTFIEELKEFININHGNKTFIIINTNGISTEDQNELVCLVKDNTYRLLHLPDTCKLIVTGDINSMDRELFGLLAIVDV